ncbi:MAG: response regulator [Anaerolineales bacterium]|nr:response regulator [Anaerolineales bacterium]
MNTEQGYLLVVEDDPDIRKMLDTTLTIKGYRVVTATNGREGLDVIQKEHPSIVIADIMMPKLDGFGLVHRIRINPETRDIPVVFITATYITPEDVKFALKIGATRFIQKPVDMEVFLSTIDDLLTRGVKAVIEPLREFGFYSEYRKRLELKLEQKNKQIARDEYLLGAFPEERDQSFRAAIIQSIHERDELKLLLDQIYIELEKFVVKK